MFSIISTIKFDEFFVRGMYFKMTLLKANVYSVANISSFICYAYK